MEVLQETAEAPYANVLLYGPPKSGKTAGAMTAPGRIVYVSADKPNRLRFGLSRDTEKRVMPVKWEGYKTLHEVMMLAHQDFADTYVLDPYGNAFDRLLREATNNVRRPALDARGNVVTDLMRFADFMCDAPCNFIIVAHQLQEKDEEAGVINSVAFTGSKSGSATVSQKLAGMVDVVGYTGRIDTENGPQYVAQIAPTPGRAVGDGFDVLDDGRGYRELNLTEWLTLAGCQLGKPWPKGKGAPQLKAVPDVSAEASAEAATTKQ